MRNSFIKTLSGLASENENIYLLTGDLGYSVFEDFQRKFSKRFINIGVSEQNMMGVAAGLALSGKTVFVYSIIPFLIFRCFEQIRNDICYHNLNVKLIGVGGGFSYGVNGPTHYALEDIAIMKTLSPMTVLCPGDPMEVECAVKSGEREKGPFYIRLGKNGEPVIHKNHFEFEIGKGITLKDGQDATIFVTGNMLESAKCVSDLLEKRGIEVRLISMPSIKPIDKEVICKAVRETNALFTIEEHIETGGFGSSVLEVIHEYRGFKPPRGTPLFKKFGVRQPLGHQIGSHDYLRRKYHLLPDQIFLEIVTFLEEHGGNEHFHYGDFIRNRKSRHNPSP